MVVVTCQRFSVRPVPALGPLVLGPVDVVISGNGSVPDSSTLRCCHER